MSAHEPGGGSLAGRRTVVTGASSGIGAATALALASAGADVVLTYASSREQANEVASGIRADARVAEAGSEVHVLQADVGSAAGCEQVVEQAGRALGGIDGWFNNAGADILTGEAGGWSAERKLDAVVDVDLLGTMRCCMALAPVLRAQETTSAIVNMGWDMEAFGLGSTESELFSATKGGVVAYTKALSRNLAPKVRVNVVCPGWIETSFGAGLDRESYDAVVEGTPMGRWGRPEDVADAVTYLLSPASGFVTGQALNVNGGAVG